MKLFLSGNEAIAFGLIEAGVRFISGYPGTPSSEVLPTAIKIKEQFGINGYFDWSVNEKVAFEEATAANFSGLSVAVVMKQVGLNVAMDPYMNTAIVGSVGGFVVVVADDPGPHSSQTEQDSRFLAQFAKIPVLEPSGPKEAYEFAKRAIELSREYSLPVMLRTTTRVSHSREDISIGKITNIDIKPQFKKDTDRFAATPHFRFLLHQKLNDKLKAIKNKSQFKELYNGKKLIITSGISFAYLCDIIDEFNLDKKVKVLKIDMPFPLNESELQRYVDNYNDVLVIEEGYPVIENQLINKTTVKGRWNGFVPSEGELTIDVIKGLLRDFGVFDFKENSEMVKPPFKRPSLCPGCGHRSAFFAIRSVFKDDAIYTGDIGCYTLGLNLKAVDTVHCMGASVSFAYGFDKAFSLDDSSKYIVATIGDSTFFHSGITPLIDAIHNNSRFILVILDNTTTAMTGNQPTPANPFNAEKGNANPISIESIVRALGIEFLKVRDAYDIEGTESDLKEAKSYIDTHKKPAVLILRHPCVYTKEGLKANPVFNDVYVDKDKCTGCKVCINRFECPSLVFDASDKKVGIDVSTCIKCGQCVFSCPYGAIKVIK
ncbi:thiamine pyrophosphate-dependent enzyme [Hippea maritima]|uniref:Indolepyruvate oxidoreductase subunit IorA n=1 Tax=Hippea maritima (strain ATCC 700847 / DSM 10411 / MH2) TaxID=760142 RepID=F2LUT7_HIPMA|nr:thiamine pyrophosphate-dependent enzyme [Hippea maritima]AEA33542.1 Indolepyruvate ferredoxin oxidoreductase [Hippea maritima DSM 10411]